MSKYFYCVLAISSLSVIGLTGCKKPATVSTVSGNLATVDGTPITYEQFYNYLQRKPAVFAAVQGRQVQVQVADTLGTQAMRDMVQQQLMLEVAKDEGVLPTPDDVTKELDRRKRQNADYITTLEHQGLSLDEIKQDVLLSLASERIQTKGVTVSVAEAKKYISDNKQAFTNPPQAKLLLVVVKSSDKAKVDADLKSGQSFPAVAMKYSTVPNARQNGGAFPVTNVSQMPPVLQKLINSTPVDKTTPWQKDGENWVKFDIQSKTPAKPMPITDDVVDAVQRELAKKKSTNGPDFQKRMIEKINSAKVDLSVPAYQDGWAAFVQSNQAHPGQAAPRTAAPGAPIPQKK